jgi:hypothetical protein
MRFSQIDSGNVLPSAHKEIVRHLKDQAARGKRPRLDLKTLSALRNYDEYRSVVEGERLRHIEKQYSDPDFMGWLDDE